MKMFRQSSGIIPLLLWLAFALPLELAAQTSNGALSGAAKDSSGAAVPQVQIILTNVNTNQKTTQPTSAEGNYTFPLLPPGTTRAWRNSP